MNGTHVYEGKIGYQGLDLADDFGLGTSIKRLEHDIEDSLLLGFLLYTVKPPCHGRIQMMHRTSTGASSASDGAAAGAAAGMAIS